MELENARNGQPEAATLREVCVEGAPRIGIGANGDVYGLEDGHVLKLYLPGLPLDVARLEMAWAEAARRGGVNAAAASELVRCGDRVGALYPLPEARTLAAVIDGDPESLEAWTLREAALLRKIHRVPCPQGLLPRATEVCHQMVDRLGAFFTGEEIDRLHRLIESLPQRDTLLHGDFHPKNIMVCGDALTLLDLADASVGHPLYDLAAAYTSFVSIPATFFGGAMTIMGMSPVLLVRSWSVLLDGYFEGFTPSQRQRAGEMCKTLGQLKRAMNLPSLGLLPNAPCEAIVADVRNRLLPAVDTLAETYGDIWEKL